MTAPSSTPAGFEPLYRESPFVQLLGPIFQKPSNGYLAVGIRVVTKHCNIRNDLHGGVLSSLADFAMGYNIAFTEQPPMSAVTASMTVDYLGRAAVGDWLEGRVSIQKKGKRLAFAQCEFYVGETMVARATGVFHVLEKRILESV